MTVDITGQKFGKLIAIEQQGYGENGDALWMCQCICRDLIVADSYSLRHGLVTSCGRMKKRPVFKLAKLGQYNTVNHWRCGKCKH